jgi:hypothetical protein
MYPVELLLIIVSYLNTRDVVVLGHTCKSLQSIAEQERKKRLDIDTLLKRFIPDPGEFRHLMRDTGAIIVGDVARAFFTGEDLPVILELLVAPQKTQDIRCCQDLWNSFFGNPHQTLDRFQIIKCAGNRHWTEEVSLSKMSAVIDTFLSLSFISSTVIRFP